jgi:hypothetical protein
MYFFKRLPSYIRISFLIVFTMTIQNAVARNAKGKIQYAEQIHEIRKPMGNKSLNRSPFALRENALETEFYDDFESEPSNWTYGDIRETNGLQWHCDSFNAYSGKSWWCGNPLVGGYLSNWYQVLITPVIDLSQSTAAKLTFMHYYAIEYDETEPPEDNPWDGCHVRISADGGNTYQLITPEGGYDAPDSLWAWEYHLEQFDGGMPGWHGFSNGWKEVSFDLAEFAGDQIQLKFIFASDAAYDVLNSDDLQGWFIDNIEVSDGDDVLFYDDAEDTVVPSPMSASEGSGLYPQGWKISTDTYHTPNHSWNCEDGYNLDNALISPWISLPQTQNSLLLSYWIYADMPDFNGDGGSELEDYYRVGVSNDGLIWKKLIHDYARASLGSDETWVQMAPGINYNGSLNLDEYRGQDVQIRWLVLTDNNDDGGNGNGLYLDDVRIYSEKKNFGNRQVISADCEFALFVRACDLDNDGDMDVLSASGHDDKIAWYENPGDGHFGDQQVITTSVNYPKTICIEDLDGDGDPDLLTGSHVTFSGMPVLNYPGKLVWIENLGQGTFGDPKTISDSVYYPNTICADDLDGDGDRDALCGSQKEITWYANDGSGNFGDENEILSPVDGAGVMQTADMDGDDDIDVVYARALPENRNLYWFENEGDGSFVYVNFISVADFAPDAFVVTDLDNDSDPDILAVNDLFDQEDQVVCFKNQDGLGTLWNFSVISTALDGAQAVYAADLDGDGDRDALTASDGDDMIAWYENNGSGGFGEPQIITREADDPNSVFAADLDGDGDNDVLSASRSDNTIAWYENLSNSTGVHPFDEDNLIPASPELAQNFPNPFNPVTKIQFSVNNAGHIKLEVYNSLGQKISTLIDDYYMAGHYKISFDGSDLPTGLYFYKMTTESLTQIRKMILIK